MIALKRLVKKAVCLLLCLCIAMVSLMPCFAVNYPQGTDNAKCEKAVENLDALIENVLRQTQNTTLKALVAKSIYSSDTLNGIFTALYGSMDDYSQALSALGVDVSPANVSSCLSAYPKVAQKIGGVTSYSELNLDGTSWGVGTKDGFCEAIAAITTPFNDVLYMLLCSGNVNISIIPIIGSDGYQNGIVPMLEALGATGLMSNDEFKSLAAQNKNEMIKNIVNMLMSRVEEILLSPVTELCDTMPGFADFMVNGGFEATMDGLLKPISIHIGEIISIVTATKMLSILLVLQDRNKYTTDFTSNVTTILNDALSSSEVTLAEIDFQELASCANRGEAFVEIFSWLIDTLKLNKDKMGTLTDGVDIDMTQLQPMLDKLLAKSTDEILAFVVELVTAENGTDLDYQWAAKQFTPTTVDFGTELTRENLQKAFDGIDGVISEAIEDGGEYNNISQAVKKNIYTSDLVANLCVMLYSALGGDELGEVTDLLGMNFSTYAVANSLGTKYYSARRTLQRTSSWKNIKPENLDFGFKPGDSKAFENALIAVLRPLRPMLEVLLCSGKIQLFDSINFCGSNGYNTAVIPLFEALGIPSEKILSYDEYKKGVGSDAIIKGLLDPIMYLLKTAEKAPLKTVLSVVPNLLFFVDNGSATQCIMNLLYPLTSLLDKLGLSLSDFAGDDIPDLEKINILDELQKKLPEITDQIGDGKIKLDDIDIKKLETLGTAETRTSVASYQGQPYTYTYIVCDGPSVLMTVLRYVVGLLQKPENADLISGFMGGGEGDGGTFAQYSSGIGDQMAAMTTDECIAWLYHLFFFERATVELTTSDYVVNIKYEKKDPPPNYKVIIPVVALIAAAAIFIIYNRESVALAIGSLKKKRSDKKAIK